MEPSGYYSLPLTHYATLNRRTLNSIAYTIQYILNLSILVIGKGLGSSGTFFAMLKLSIQDNKQIKINWLHLSQILFWPESMLLSRWFSLPLFLITSIIKKMKYIEWMTVSLWFSSSFNFFHKRGKNESSINTAERRKLVLFLYHTYSRSLLNRKTLTAKLNLDMLIAKAIPQYGTSIACYGLENQKLFSSMPLT